MYNDYKWFMIHTYSGYEKKVSENITIAAKNNKLDDQIVAACVPVVLVEKKKVKSSERKKKTAKNEFILVKEEIKDEYIVLTEEEKKKKAEEMRNSLEVGDKITTIGGLVGKIVHIGGDLITFETGEDRVRIQVTKWAISTNGVQKGEQESK